MMDLKKLRELAEKATSWLLLDALGSRQRSNYILFWSIGGVNMEAFLWERFLTLACDKVMSHGERNRQVCLNNAWWADMAEPKSKRGRGERNCFIIAWNVEATYTDQK